MVRVIFNAAQFQVFTKVLPELLVILKMHHVLINGLKSNIITKRILLKYITSLFSLREMPSIMSNAFRTNLFLIMRTYRIRKKPIKVIQISEEINKRRKRGISEEGNIAFQRTDLQYGFLEGSRVTHSGADHLNPRLPLQSSNILGTNKP